MKALIVEDELMARAQLKRLLAANFPGITIEHEAGSVGEAVSYLNANPAPDVIFMDVELSDGNCFEIFRQVDVQSPVIMTTAYDSYAIKAFEAGSVDYLLKPIDIQSLKRAVDRVASRRNPQDLKALLSALNIAPAPKWKSRSTVRVGDRIVPINADEIAFFYSDEGENYLMTLAGDKYLIESTFDQLEDELNPEKFFRISRGCIVSISAIKTASRTDSGRLLLTTSPKAPTELAVSRARVEDFLHWLE